MNRVFGRTILYVADKELVAMFDGEPAFIFCLDSGTYRLSQESVDDYVERIMREDEYEQEEGNE